MCFPKYKLLIVSRASRAGCEGWEAERETIIIAMRAATHESGAVSSLRLYEISSPFFRAWLIPSSVPCSIHDPRCATTRRFNCACMHTCRYNGGDTCTLLSAASTFLPTNVLVSPILRKYTINVSFSFILYVTLHRCYSFFSYIISFPEKNFAFPETIDLEIDLEFHASSHDERTLSAL